jgi:membrane fusion protein, multidrug efflux system
MENQEQNLNETQKRLSVKAIFLIIAVSVIILGIGTIAIYSVWSHESTDNAQINGDIIPLRTTITGFVRQIRFNENGQVKKGDTLVLFDTVDLVAQVKQAEAQLNAAQTEFESSRKQVTASSFSNNQADFSSNSVKENIKVASSRQWQANSDFERVKKMFAQGAATQQAFDNAKTSLEMANAQLNAAKEQYQASDAQKLTVHSQFDIHNLQVKLTEARIRQAQAQLTLTLTQYSRAFVTAPCNGIVSNKNVNVGQMVPAGTPLATLINISDLWVSANFKETQLTDMVLGQAAEIKVDAYPGLKLSGKVESFCGGTGAKFSILPAENATGNFIKVTQRVPVRISILTRESQKLLLPGMNVVVSIKTR